MCFFSLAENIGEGLWRFEYEPDVAAPGSGGERRKQRDEVGCLDNMGSPLVVKPCKVVSV